MLRGQNTPAFAGWALFALITIINVVMNLGFTTKRATVLLLATDFLTCVGTSVLIVVRTRGNVSIDKRDKQIGALSILAIVLWIVFRSSVVGVLLNQIAYSFAFWPTYRNVRRNPLDEPTWPWLTWTIAFVIDLVALGIDPTSVFLDYVTPSVCLAWHGFITVLSLRKLKK